MEIEKLAWGLYFKKVFLYDKNTILKVNTNYQQVG
jgi:hypothetical protein